MPSTTLCDAQLLGLTQEEYSKICTLLQRDPTPLELALFSAMWNEHCSYKSSRIHLAKLPKSGARVLVGPGENAGVIDVGDGLAVAFKVESHNHPSFIEPFQGAATGMGGILRDIFTMGARPFAAMNLLRFGEKTHPKTSYLMHGVISGISSYGNCFGVPTVESDVDFDASYNGNILVNAFAIGVVAHTQIYKARADGVGQRVFYAGAKTGRDGIHGASMASSEFSEQKEASRPTVQVGDPFKEKLLLEACMECFENDVIEGIQDMGAAGLTSSSFEMVARAGTGLRMDLSRVPTRESGMTPFELMLSESQERMLIVCKKGKEEVLQQIFEKWELDCVDLGEVTADGNVRLLWHGDEICALPATWLTDDAPKYDRQCKQPSTRKPFVVKPQTHIDDAFFEQYDCHIGVNTLLAMGEADAALVQIPGSKKAIAITIGCDTQACAHDPREGARRTLARAFLRIACVGAETIGASDCLNFGSPENPEGMWQLKEAIEGLAEAAEELNIPIVSGNVSLYNETDGVPICPTPTVALVGLHPEPSFYARNQMHAEDVQLLIKPSVCPQNWNLQDVQMLAQITITLVRKGWVRGATQNRHSEDPEIQFCFKKENLPDVLSMLPAECAYQILSEA